MARPAKRTPEVYQMLVERIRRGDYGTGPLPSTRKLGAEFGVSKFTILRAFRQAEKEGILVPQGRNRVAGGKAARRKKALRFACVVPAVDLVSSFHWFLSIDNVATKSNGSATPIDYRNVSDPRLTQALGGKFDVIFLDPPHGELTPLVRRLLQENRECIVPLYEDIPELELWGIDNMPVGAVDLLVFHLASFGHRKIHLLGSLPILGRQKQLFERWKLRLEAVGASGHALFPEEEPACLATAAMVLTRKFLESNPNPGAILFADLPSAIGGYRALWEAGIKPGSGVSVAALTCEPEAALMTPSLTCLDVPSRESVIAGTVETVLKGAAAERHNWADTVLQKVRLLQGESSGVRKRSSI
jgi:DNA-binding LacI/PurR family transcriptional regulator